jgi:hypothetical protein
MDLSFLSRINIAGIIIGILLLIYFIYIFLIQYHLIRFGVGIRPKIMAAVFVFGSLILLLPVIFFYIKFDFQEFMGALGGNFSYDSQQEWPNLP